MIKTLSDRCSSAQPLALNPIRSDVWRGDVLESTHEVHAALVDASGQLLAYAGNPHLLTTARSSLKPFQLLPTLLQGGYERFGLNSADLAFMCASHNGEPQHVAHCIKLLNKLQVQSRDLECGVHPPYHMESARAIYRAGLEPTAVHNNCSGKHCGMLALRELLSSKGSYLSIDHPVQNEIFECIESLLGKKREWKWGVDGCSLPTPAVTLVELSTLFAILARGQSEHNQWAGKYLSMIFEAMSKHPELIAGSGRFDTAFMRAAAGNAVCKVGGEAIRGFAIRSSSGQVMGLTLKVTDGAMRALHPACLALLEYLELIERPSHLKLSSKSLSGLDTFWRGVELNCSGREATEIRVGIQESLSN